MTHSKATIICPNCSKKMKPWKRDDLSWKCNDCKKVNYHEMWGIAATPDLVRKWRRQ